MAIGRKMRNAKQLRKAMQANKAGAFKFVPKDGGLTVRFTEEPEGHWVEYDEHWDTQARTSFPCIGEEEGCPGCEEGFRRSTKFIANAVDIENDRAIVVQMPKSLANSVYKFYDKYDTILDRDYELNREGEGLDTEYYATPEDKYKRNIKKYEKKDLEVLLEEVAEEYLSAQDDDDEDDRPSRKTKGRTKSKAAPNRRKRATRDDDDDDDDEDDDDYEEEDDDEEDEDDEPVRRKKTSPSRSKKATASRKRPSDDDDEEEDDEEEDDEEPVRSKKTAPSRSKKSPARRKPPVDDDEDDENEDDDEEYEDEEEDDEEEEDEGEDEFYTEAELKDMTVAQLRILAKEYDIKTTGMKKPELVEAILG